MQGRTMEGTLGTHPAKAREALHGVLDVITDQMTAGDAVNIAGFRDTSSSLQSLGPDEPATDLLQPRDTLHQLGIEPQVVEGCQAQGQRIAHLKEVMQISQ